MSSIDDRGQRAGADLRRAARHHAGPPLAEITSRRSGHLNRTVAIGLVVAVIAGGAWSVARPDATPESVEVSSAGPGEGSTVGEDGRPAPGRNDADGEPAASPDGAPAGSSDTAPETTGPSVANPVAPTTPRSGGQPSTRPTTRSAPSAASPATPDPSGSPSPSIQPPSSQPTTPDAPETPDPPTSTPPSTTPPSTTPPTTVPAVLGPPTGPLTPTSSAWAPTCAAADEFLQLAWAVHTGSSDDTVEVALRFIRTIRSVPAGTAPVEVAYTESLLRSIEQGQRVAPFAADFLPNADTLVLVIGAGCGTPEGLPVPPSTLPRLYSQLFESGIF